MGVSPKSMEWKNKPKKRVSLDRPRSAGNWIDAEGKPTKEMFRVMCEAGQFIAMHKGYAGFSLRDDGHELLFMVSAGDYECKEWIRNGADADTLLMSLSSEISATKNRH